MADHHSTVAAGAAKLVPPVTVSGMTVAGYPLSEVVLLVTLVYTVAQLGFLISDKIGEYRERKREEAERTARQSS